MLELYFEIYNVCLIPIPVKFPRCNPPLISFTTSVILTLRTNIYSIQRSRVPGALILVAENFFVKLEGLIPRCFHTKILIILFLWCPAVMRVVVDSGCVYIKLCCSRSVEMYLSIEHDLHVCCTEYISITNFKFRWFLESWHTTVTIHLMYHHLLCTWYFKKLKCSRYKGLAILSVLKLVWLWCIYLILLLAVNIFTRIRLYFVIHSLNMKEPSAKFTLKKLLV